MTHASATCEACLTLKDWASKHMDLKAMHYPTSPRGFVTAALLLLLTACVPGYVPVADGRVSVIDLVMFGNLYVNKSITSYGHLMVDPAGPGATLFFHADHATRRGERFALPVAFPVDSDRERIKACHGKEVLLRGSISKTPAGHVLNSGADIVC